MSLLAAEDLHLSFGSKRIFAGDSLAVEPGDRLGLVGPNGAGKSTLLRILAGRAQPDGGRVRQAKGLRVGYLAQEHGDASDTPLLASVLAEAPGRDALEDRLAECERALAEATDEDEQLERSERLAQLHEELADLEQSYGAHRAEAILYGLGFGEADLSRPLSELSGGWRMRAALAALLFAKPDVLLLDEPTNHLDLPTVHWLSGFLSGVRQAVVLTCHDRAFLNRHVRRVASLELDGLKTFRGDYDAYLEQRALELAHLEARIEKNAERARQLEAFVDRFRAKATKARQAQSRVKQIEKLREQQVELPEVRRALHVRFPAVERSSERVLRIEGMGFGYEPEEPVLGGVAAEVRRQDRIAIVGVNGAGKTTLLRLIAQELVPDVGTIELGRGVRTSYFAQHHAEALEAGRTVLDEVRAAAPESSETQARALCGAVLFSGDEVDKPIAVLSGGEKARVALARMLARPANLLLLDEPTNHLDTESADVLTESLERFEGTLIFVSHDLGFAERLATKVWDVSGGRLEAFPGGLRAYLDRLDGAAIDDTFARLGSAPARRAGPAEPDKQARIAAREAKKRDEAEHRRRRRRVEAAVERAEAEIARLEAEKGSAEAALTDPAVLADPDRIAAEGARLAAAEADLAAALDAWTEAEAEREALSEASEAE